MIKSTQLRKESKIWYWTKEQLLVKELKWWKKWLIEKLEML